MTHVAQVASRLLVVRRADDLASAIAGINQFMGYRRRGASDNRDEVLGLWLRRELGADLPMWPLDPATSTLDRADGLGVRESFSLSGIWSMCWIDGTLMSACQSTKERRCRVVDMLSRVTSGRSTTGNLGVFLPVVDGAQDTESIEETLAELRARFTGLIGDAWLVDDPKAGLADPRRSR